MAKIEFSGIDEYAEKLERLKAKSEGVIKYASYEAAGMVADAIKYNTPVAVEDGGDLRESLFLTSFTDKDGFVYTEVKFGGYDRRGVPNQLKAAVLEHGSSTRRKHLFIRPAVNRVKLAAELSMETRLNEKINEIMNT